MIHVIFQPSRNSGGENFRSRVGHVDEFLGPGKSEFNDHLTWQFCDRDLFGIVKTRPELKGWKRDLQRLGMKRSRLESPGYGFLFCFVGWSFVGSGQTHSTKTAKIFSGRLGLVGNLELEFKKGKGLFQAKHQQLGAQLPVVGRITIHLRSCLGEVAAYSHI